LPRVRAVAPVEQADRIADRPAHHPTQIVRLALGCRNDRIGRQCRLDVQPDHGGIRAGRAALRDTGTAYPLASRLAAIPALPWVDIGV